MMKNDLKKLHCIDKALDKSLSLLDCLRYKTDKEEEMVLDLLRKQSLLMDKLNIKN